MLQQVMFTSTSKAIRCKPQGLRWVCRPSHLRLTSPKHSASSCHNSIQVHFGLTQAPPLLVEVIPDYRATVVKCWYNVFFLFFSPLSLFAQLFSNSRSSHGSSLVWLTLGKTDISLQFNALGQHWWLWEETFLMKESVEFKLYMRIWQILAFKVKLFSSKIALWELTYRSDSGVQGKSRQATGNSEHTKRDLHSTTKMVIFHWSKKV